MTFFVNPSMLQALQQGQTPLSIQAHRDVARRYGIPTIHLAKEVAEKVSAGSLTWETYGGTHPKEPGNRMCTEMIDRLLDQAWSEDTSNGAREGKTVLPAPLDEYNYDQGRFIAVEQADTDAHWRTAIPDWQNIRGAKRERFTNVPMLVADRPGAELSLSFVGKAVGIYLVAGPDAGMVEASVDGGPFTRYDLLHHFSKGLHYPRSVMFANQLDSNKHVLRIRVVQPESSECGTAVRIMKFVAN